MNLLRKIKVAALIFGLTVVLWGSLYMTAAAKKCLLLCVLDPVYVCKVICY
jgi:hypothetical protein